MKNNQSDMLKKQKVALIIGITGQDGAYMSQFLLNKNYKVYGIARTISKEKLWRLDELGIKNDVKIMKADITNSAEIVNLFEKIQPSECYNFAALSSVGNSWNLPNETLNINTNGVLNILEAIKKKSLHTRLYQAGSSELFGRPKQKIQDEETPFNPCNPYGVSKLAAYNLLKIYREAYNIYVCQAFCYNHESPLRDLEYVTRKITSTVAKIKNKKADEIRLGNIKSKRDWGSAIDYVDAMWRMLQQDKPDDYIIATGQTHSIEDLLKIAFARVNISDWKKYVVIDKNFYRPLDSITLCGDAKKAKHKLNWEPKRTFKEIIEEMVDVDLKRFQ